MKLNKISVICSLLHEEALNKSFYLKSEDELNKSANKFVDDFGAKHNLTAHTISPMRWNFESTEYGMIDDGVIELRNANNDETRFTYVDVSNAKLTDEKNIMNE